MAHRLNSLRSRSNRARHSLADYRGRKVLLVFSDPQAVRSLLSGSFGELPFCAYRIGAQTRIARVRFYRIRGNGEDYACVSVLARSVRQRLRLPWPQ